MGLCRSTRIAGGAHWYEAAGLEFAAAKRVTKVGVREKLSPCSKNGSDT